jgi:predicted nucleic acid-binding Zn ribbon protein
MTDEDLSRDTLPAPSYNYRCKDCDEVFPNTKQLTHHYRMDHPEGL